MSVPAPVAVPAAALLRFIREQGGRVFRYVEPPQVFVLTTDPKLAQWIVKRGGKPFVPVGMDIRHDGSYLRAKGGVREWDIRINMIPVTEIDEPGHAAWKAAA